MWFCRRHVGRSTRWRAAPLLFWAFGPCGYPESCAPPRSKYHCLKTMASGGPKDGRDALSRWPNARPVGEAMQGLAKDRAQISAGVGPIVENIGGATICA